MIDSKGEPWSALAKSNSNTKSKTPLKRKWGLMAPMRFGVPKKEFDYADFLIDGLTYFALPALRPIVF